jgi:hypothetical protein
MSCVFAIFHKRLKSSNSLYINLFLLNVPLFPDYMLLDHFRMLGEGKINQMDQSMIIQEVLEAT